MKCKVMGIVNVTPDSFSDGGRFFSSGEAIRRARNLVADGADILDIGGESTRPGATPIGWEAEWERVGPVLEGLRGVKVPVSVDTYHPETARRALEAGASMINCVYAEPAGEMAKLCRESGASLVAPARCLADLAASGAVFFIDPMIGFGTTREEDLALLRSVPALARKAPVLVGASRKRIVKKLTGEKVTGRNVGGSLGIALWCAAHGASIVRVHDVKETVQALAGFGVLDGADGDSPA